MTDEHTINYWFCAECGTLIIGDGCSCNGNYTLCAECEGKQMDSEKFKEALFAMCSEKSNEMNGDE